MPITKSAGKGAPQSGPGENSTRQRIVEGARSHFFTHGFRGVTMDDLAEELGMSKKTLYAHFPSKMALLEAVLTDKFERVDAELGQVSSGDSADIVSNMRRLLACLQQHLHEIQPPFTRDIHRTAPEMFKLIQANRGKLVKRHFGWLLKEGRTHGTIRKDIPPELMMELLLGTINAIANPVKLAELQLTPQDALSTILTIFFQGVLTEDNRTKL